MTIDEANDITNIMLIKYFVDGLREIKKQKLLKFTDEFFKSETEKHPEKSIAHFKIKLDGNGRLI